MDKSTSVLTILFDDPFWVGIYERESGRKYAVCRILFGAEPTDSEIYEYFLKKWNSLCFSPSIDVHSTLGKQRINPKRMQRAIKKQLQNNGIGTKAQQALKLQYEQGKVAHKLRSREAREMEQERKFELRRQKQKEKRKGH